MPDHDRSESSHRLLNNSTSLFRIFVLTDTHSKGLSNVLYYSRNFPACSSVSIFRNVFDGR